MRLLAVLIITASIGGCLDVDGLSDLIGAAPEPIPATLFLTPEHQMRSTAPEATSEPLDWSWFDWSQGRTPPQWSGPTYDAPTLILEASATIVYEAKTTLFDSQSRPPFTIWFGVEDRMTEHAFEEGPDVWQPGTQTITFTIDDLPLGGLYIPKGEAPVIRVGTYYNDGEGQENVWIHMGIEASHVDVVTLETLDGTVENMESVVSSSVQLEGGRCIADANVAGSAMAEYSFDVPPGALALDASAARVEGYGFGPDMDMRIYDNDGETVGRAAGSSSPERIVLGAENMKAATPGIWTLRVYNCQPQIATFQVDAVLST